MKLTDRTVEKLLAGYPLEEKQLMWKGQPVPDHTIRNDGVLFRHGKRCSSWKINGRNYSEVVIENRRWTYRIDYMVAYTYLGMYDDAIRLIHLNDDIADDRLQNLKWYRRCDVVAEYKDKAIIETDGSIKEEWRPCLTEYNGSLRYEVSNLGCIRDSVGKLIPIYDSHGYRVFYYLDTNSKTTRLKQVHRAVAEAFLPNPHGYDLVNHLDGNGYNDTVYNLEWASRGMNAEHAYLQKLNIRSGYDIGQIKLVCELLSAGNVQHVHIAGMTGVDRKTISDIYRKRRWQEVSKDYNFAPKKWTPEIKATICAKIIAGQKGAEIFRDLGIDYNQSAISLYERLRRELKAQGKIS